MAYSLSIVTTLYRSEDTIEEFLVRASAAAEGVYKSIEIIVVDDGSPDESADLVRAMAETDPRITLVKLSKNFGHHKAMLIGLEHARGDLVFLIDSDLEEPPELMADMARYMNEQSVDCVYGVQIKRKGGVVERFTGRIFYWLFSALSEVRLPENVSTVRLMTRRYVRSLLRFRDKNPVFVPLSIMAGYRQSAFPFVKASTSDTTYSFARRIALALLMITTFTGKPLQLMFSLSAFLSVLGLSYGGYVVLRALSGPTQDGWSSLMAVVVFFFSLNAVFTGVIGLYVKQILDEVKDRPRVIVQEIYRGISLEAREERDE